MSQSVFSTPDTSILLRRPADFNEVYHPSEDSFLMLDALQADYALIRDLRPSLVCEVGSGSGVISTFLRQFNPNPAYYLAIDISPSACLATKSVLATNMSKNSSSAIPVDILQSSLLSAVKGRLVGSIDLLLFNPPYVPTGRDEHANSSSIAWSGGHQGREVIDAFLAQAIPCLTANGCIYLLLVEENRPEEVHQLVSRLSNSQLRATLVKQRRACNELLSVWRYSRA